MEKNYFVGLDFSAFWNDSDYALREYVCDSFTDDFLASIEEELGYKLPRAYVALMRMHNGGIPVKTRFPIKKASSWAQDYIAIYGIMGIGREKPMAICGKFGSQFWIKEWYYPDIGVVICDCPSAGHDLVMLDYRKCGKDGEPEIVHVDQEDNYKVTFLAKDFETFICGLVNDGVYDNLEEKTHADFEIVEHGAFSSLLTELCNQRLSIENVEEKIRAIAKKIVKEKGFFALHADMLSVLMYDLQFWLFTKSKPNVTASQYIKEYENILTFSGEFKTGGYAPKFVTNWFNDRIEQGMIVERNKIISFTKTAEEELLIRLAKAME